ncbi:MAG TPA: hypothetical protein VE218_11260, partial [Acidobacteriaceae bacterium]|nr:hypothetical protein [Acidobacteriaceae bacterium]
MPERYLILINALLMIEKFGATELTNLRNELLRVQLDSWQAADLAANFLAGHGSSAEELASAEEQKFFFTLCRIRLPPFVVIVKAANFLAGHGYGA